MSGHGRGAGLTPGDILDLVIEKPAAGGRMIARHAGQVVLVQGAIPGERVTVRVQKAGRQVAFADTIDVREPSPDREAGARDLQCGGLLYAHIAYARQLALKREIVHDAFERLARLHPPEPVQVEASPPRAYRMRARLHVRGEAVGFYREGSHELCDAAATGQLRDEAIDSARQVAGSLLRHGCALQSIEVAESLDASQRVLHVTNAGESRPDQEILEAAAAAAGVSGVTARDRGRLLAGGSPVVIDALSPLTEGRAGRGALERHAESFFQGNRFLVPRLVSAVLDGIAGGGPVIDLYAGVGLFSLAAAAAHGVPVTAVEGDSVSGADLRRNAAASGLPVRVVLGGVEEYLQGLTPPCAGTIIVDPPRTGISRRAMEALAGCGAPRILYVSCDPPTMARDARRLVDAGYRMEALRAFDLFPGTPHVEALGRFER